MIITVIRRVPLQGRSKRPASFPPPKRKRFRAQAFPGSVLRVRKYSRCVDGRRRMRLGLKLGRTDGLAGSTSSSRKDQAASCWDQVPIADGRKMEEADHPGVPGLIRFLLKGQGRRLGECVHGVDDERLKVNRAEFDGLEQILHGGRWAALLGREGKGREGKGHHFAS